MAFMEKNVGMVDRAVRIVVGLGLLVVGWLYLSAPLLYVVALIGLFALLTGTLGTCPVYSLLGINTLGKENAVPKTKK